MELILTPVILNEVTDIPEVNLALFFFFFVEVETIFGCLPTKLSGPSRNQT